MSNVIYFSFPAYGHINPTLAIMTELVRRGEQVHYYALEQFRPAIESTGATFCDYDSDFSIPEQGAGAFAQLETTIDTLLTLSHSVLTHHLETVSAFQPAYIMHDAFSPWGRFIAQALHLPAAVSVPSIAVNQQIAEGQVAAQPTGGAQAASQQTWWEHTQQRLADLAGQFGLPRLYNPYELMHAYSDLNLVYTSRLFQPLADSFDAQRFQFVGPCLRTPSEQTAFPLEALDGRPVLYISLGTVYTDRLAFFQACLQAFARSRWQVVMAIGNVPRPALGPIPDNFLVQAFVPQLDLLPRTTLFITHGGMNSVNEALFYDIPLLVVPQWADQFWIARRAAELGAAEVLLDTQVTSEQLCQNVEHIAAHREYAEAARKIGASLRTAGGVQKAVGVLEAFKQARGREEKPS
ncbi:MAG: hypothetical protein M3Y39_16455 [Chloroflexota bacterium]|nr:hypothetical protein [Chloroflexota bacterium]